MTPLPIYLASQQPNLLVGFGEFLVEMASTVGYGVDPTLWSTAQAAELDRAVQESYRYVLYPSKIPGGAMPHTWSCLRQITTLTTVSGTVSYTLPADFGSLHGRFLTYPADTGFTPIMPTSAQKIRAMRQQSSQTGQPWLYALQWSAQTTGLSQRQSIMFYPTPDDAYVLTYEYAVLIGKLSYTNPYPLGGPRMSQLMIEACKAVGETKKNGFRGDQWGIFREALADAIALDASTNTERTVGMMIEPTSVDSAVVFGVRSTETSTYAGIG